MAINTLEYSKIFQQSLDQQIIEQSTTGWMELNSGLVKYNGGDEVKIPTIIMDGLADYDRDLGFVQGSVSLSYKTYTLTQDRGRTFMLDRMDVDETNFIVASGTVMGEFQRAKVIPEIDAYRYSKIAQIAISKGNISYGYNPSANSILDKLLEDITTVQDKVGESTPLVITMSLPTARILSLNDKTSKKLDVTNFKQGNIDLKVNSIDGIPIIRVSSFLLKTSYEFYSGKDEAQKEGGFKADADAKDINWIITAKKAPIAISKTEKVRIFEPDTNQKADAWKLDYRKYHDLWILENQIDGVFVNIKEAV